MLALWGDVKLPALFADHGVLARSAKTPIFGKAAPGEVVTVKLADLQGKATADAAGKWRVDLDVSKLGDGPYELTIAGKNTIVLKDECRRALNGTSYGKTAHGGCGSWIPSAKCVWLAMRE